jgi:HPt (histidine-containing phosphotransfer) domain-containing protein
VELDPAALDRLRMVGADGVSLLQKLIGVYLADTPAQLAALGAAVAGNDLRAVRRIAHTLKSSSALLGAAGLASQFAELESRAGEGAGGSMDMLVQIQQEYSRTAMALELRRASEMTHA